MWYLFKLHLPFTQMFASHLNSIGARSGKGEGFTDKASVEFIFRESEEWMKHMGRAEQQRISERKIYCKIPPKGNIEKCESWH